MTNYPRLLLPLHIQIPLAVACLTTLLSSAILAQGYKYTPVYPAAPPVTPYQILPAAVYTADQLDQMLAPIALYPDPLLSELLAATTYPQDVAAAAQWLQYHPNPSESDLSSQPWDSSVKAIAHYPTVLQMLAGQMDWTQALGNAFASNPQEVMNSVQRLRASAQAAHTLFTTPQQEIIVDNGIIEILPAQPQVIYVPQYNPEIIYAPPPYYTGDWITFGSPFSVGLWFDLGWDWHQHRFDRGVHWDRDWHHPDFGHVEPWEHDRSRPVPMPTHPFIPPRGPDTHRGWNEPGRPAGAFDRRLAPRPPSAPVNSPQRPVRDLPRAPERAPTPAPITATPPPSAPQTPPPPRTTPPAPIRPSPPPPQPAPPPPGRPVTGLPPRAAPIQPAPPPPVRPAVPVPMAPPRATPAAPPPRVAPVPPPPRVTPTAPPPRAPAAAPRSTPSSAFRPGNGNPDASDRGHSSMRR